MPRRTQALGLCPLAEQPAAMVTQQIARHSHKPRQRLVAWRHPVKTPPHDLIRPGYHVVGIGTANTAMAHIPSDGRIRRLEQSTKPGFCIFHRKGYVANQRSVTTNPKIRRLEAPYGQNGSSWRRGLIVFY